MKKAGKQEAKVEKKPEKPPSPEPTPPPKQEYITRKIGGKIRRIPVSSLKKAEEKKAEKRRQKRCLKLPLLRRKMTGQKRSQKSRPNYRRKVSRI